MYYIKIVYTMPIIASEGTPINICNQLKKNPKLQLILTKGDWDTGEI